MEVFVGRQPIFNIYEQVVAYELLYRSTNMNAFTGIDADGATVDVLINSFLNIGIHEVTNGKPGFVNFTKNLLLSPLADSLEPGQVVIEILEDVEITPQIIQSIEELKFAGFRVALDDFVLDDTVGTYNDLFRLIDYIKVDFLLSPLEDCLAMERVVKSKFPHIQLLAEKVETREQFDAARQAGYDLFQGYFFEKPQVMSVTEIPINTMQYFQLMSLLNEDEPDIEALTKVIEHDISLSYKLLQLINSFNKRGKASIKSIKQAVLLVGLIELRKWIFLLAMRENAKEQDYDVFLELMRSSMFRARVCEMLAKKTGKVKHAECFLVGMFSLMDALLKRPMDLIVAQLPLSELVSDTLLDNDTELLPYLKCSIALEKMDIERAEEIVQQLGIGELKLETLYNEAMEWTEKTIQAF